MGLEIKVGIGSCHIHQARPGSDFSKVTIVIAPLRVEEKGNVTLLAWACSMGNRCCNSPCVYAKGHLAGRTKDYSTHEEIPVSDNIPNH